MKFRCERDDLLEAVQFASRAISNRGTLPVLSGLRMQATAPGEVAVAATDLELTMETTFKAAVDEPGTVIAPGRLFAEMTRSLGAGQVSVAATDGEVEIGSGRGQFRVKSLSAEDYPALPIDDREDAGLPIEVDGGALAGALAQVVKSASSDESRQVLTGVLCEIEADELTLAATDSYRLAVRRVKLAKGGEDGRKVILPARALGELGRTLATASGTVRALVKDNFVVFYVDPERDGSGAGESVIGSRFIEGEFPNYRQLLPTGYPNTLTIGRDALIEVVKRVGLLARDNMPVKLHLASELEVSAHTPDVGEGQEVLDADHQGDAMVIAFNPQFLLDGITAIQGERVELNAIDGLKPAIIRGEGDDGFTYLLMPVRLS